LARRPERLAKLALALIADRVVEPAAKLATARQLSEATAAHSLGALLGVSEVDEDELYRPLDVLGAAQPAIERALARRHLKDGTLVLYDVERARKREDLLAASEEDLAKIRAATTRARNPLRGAAAIALKAGSVLGRRKVAKHDHQRHHLRVHAG
jgi:hypothetical protein